MSKYNVTFKQCGHEGTVELFGKCSERYRKLEYMSENYLCPECYKKLMEEQKAEGCEEVEMHYSEYKREYADCKTKDGSYDRATKNNYCVCSERRREIKMKRKGRIRKTKRMFCKFWREWGITLQEFEMLLSACGIFMFPFLLRIFLAFFGI